MSQNWCVNNNLIGISFILGRDPFSLFGNFEIRVIDYITRVIKGEVFGAVWPILDQSNLKISKVSLTTATQLIELLEFTGPWSLRSRRPVWKSTTYLNHQLKDLIVNVFSNIKKITNHCKCVHAWKTEW